MKGVWILGYCLKACRCFLLSGHFLGGGSMSAKCLEGAWKVFWCYRDSVWTKFGRCLDGVCILGYNLVGVMKMFVCNRIGIRTLSW